MVEGHSVSLKDTSPAVRQGHFATRTLPSVITKGFCFRPRRERTGEVGSMAEEGRVDIPGYFER